MTVRRSLLTAVLASTAAVLLPVTAWANPHEDSDPQQGTRLDSFPDQIAIRFATEVAEPVSLSVATAEGEILAEDVETVVDGRQIFAEVAELDQTGAFLVSYTVTGPEGRPLTGQIDFEVVDPAEAEAGPGTQAEEVAEAEQGTNWRGLVIIATGVLLALAVVVISWRLLRGRPERDSLDEPLP